GGRHRPVPPAGRAVPGDGPPGLAGDAECRGRHLPLPPLGRGPDDPEGRLADGRGQAEGQGADRARGRGGRPRRGGGGGGGRCPGGAGEGEGVVTRRATAVVRGCTARVRPEGQEGVDEEFATVRGLSAEKIRLHLDRPFAGGTLLLVDPLSPGPRTLLARV